MKPRTLTLAEVMAGVERAHKRVERWPQWKRELSGQDQIGTEGIEVLAAKAAHLRTTGPECLDDERIMLTKTRLTLSPNLTWTTPPVYQGRIIEVSYASDPDACVYWRRAYDRRDGTVTLKYCFYTDAQSVSWEPWNRVPTDIKWKKIP